MEFPMLRIDKLKCHSPFRYILSGGVSLKQLVPCFTYGAVKGIETLLSPLSKVLGMFLTVEITKVEE